MKKRLTLPQLKKYDITQKVIEALADAESRAIVFSITKKAKTANDLAEKHKIPLSSVYKKLTDLENLSLVEVDKLLIAENGHKFKLYKSRISKADISIKKPEPILNLTPNIK